MIIVATIIPVTFQLLLTIWAAAVGAGPTSAAPEDETLTTYCPWPPCYAQAWNLDYAKVPLPAPTNESTEIKTSTPLPPTIIPAQGVSSHIFAIILHPLIYDNDHKMTSEVGVQGPFIL